MGKAFATFGGGIHPHEYKEYTEHLEVEVFPLPDTVVIPLSQHIGAPCKPLVKKGDEVVCGQMIGQSESFISAPVHSSVSGKVIDIINHIHPLGSRVPSVKIQVTDKTRPTYKNTLPPLDTIDPQSIVQAIKDAGIVGLGGATFPTSVKTSPPPDKKIDTLVVNGCECEPFLTADHRVMLERSADLIFGIRALRRALGTQQAIIGIENNKPDAIKALKAQTADDSAISVQSLIVKYPQGAEKMLINAALGRKVPAGGLPMDVGVVVVNVGTAIAIAEALKYKKPLIERVVTVSGDGIVNPKNLLIPIGVSFADVIAYCGGLKDGVDRVIMGGPMMGLAQSDLSVPVIKGTSGILAMTGTAAQETAYSACIKCGRCIQACPMFLNPSRLGSIVEHNRDDLLDQYHIRDCMECGSCVYVCPAKRPMVHWIKVGKNRILSQQKKSK